MDTRNALKKKIKAKYGGVSEFARLADTDYWKAVRILNGYSGDEDDVIDLEDMVDRTRAVRDLAKEVIQKAEREKIRKAIFMQYRTPTRFCARCPEFDTPYISRIINGQAMRRTPRYDLLLKKLKINESGKEN